MKRNRGRQPHARASLAGCPARWEEQKGELLLSWRTSNQPPCFSLRERLPFALWLCCLPWGITPDLCPALPTIFFPLCGFFRPEGRLKHSPVHPETVLCKVTAQQYLRLDWGRIRNWIFMFSHQDGPSCQTAMHIYFDNENLYSSKMCYKKDCKWAIILKIQLQFLPVTLLMFLHY